MGRTASILRRPSPRPAVADLQTTSSKHLLPTFGDEDEQDDEERIAATVQVRTLRGEYAGGGTKSWGDPVGVCICVCERERVCCRCCIYIFVYIYVYLCIYT